MKNRIVISVLAGIALLAALAAPLAAQKNPKDKFDFPKLNPIQSPKVERLTLANGIRLFLVEDRTFPTIDIQGIFYAGSVFEPAGLSGLASLTGTVLRTGGTKSMSGDQIDRELETMAASIETSIDEESGSLSVSMLKENADRVLAMLGEILQHPAFAEEKIDLAKIELRTAISRRNDNVGQIASREFNRLIYGRDSAYGRQPEYATVEAIQRADLIAYYRRFVHPNNLWLAVWGDFDNRLMAKKIEKALGAWPKAALDLPALPQVNAPFTAGVHYIEKTDVNQSNIALGHLGGLMSDPDYPALQIMNRILSFDRMFKRVRTDEGLAYSVWGAYGSGMRVPEPFSAGAQTKSGSTVKAIRIMIEEMRRMTKEEVSDEELQRAKEQFLNSYVFAFDSRAKIINRMLSLAFYGYPLDFAEKLFARIESVGKADILAAAQRRLHPDQVQILVVGKKEDFDKPLSELGAVNVIDISIPVPKAEAGPAATADSLVKGGELFAKAVAAMGDPAAIRGLKSLRIETDMDAGGMKIAAEITIVYPDKVHMALDTPQGKVAMVLAGGKAVVRMAQGAFPLPEAQKRELADNLLRDPICIWQNLDKYKIQLVGKTKRGEAEVFDLLVSGPVDPFHLYLDAATLLPAGSSYQGLTATGPAAIEEFSSDYRDVSGIRMAFKSHSKNDGKEGQAQTIKAIQVNVPAPEELFKID